MMNFCRSGRAFVIRFAIPFFKPHVAGAAVLLAVLCHTAGVNAVTLYWDANSSLAGTGPWDVNTTTNWKTTNTAGAPDAKWFPNDGTVAAAFGGNPGAGVAGSGVGNATNGQITIAAATTVNVDSLIIQPSAGNYSITGGTINITNPNRSIVMFTQGSGAARAEIINSAISGGTITQVADFASNNPASARLDIGDNRSTVTPPPNTFTGDLIFTGTGTGLNNGVFAQINLNNAVALPSTATIRMRRDESQLLFTAAGVAGTNPYTQTYNNNIILNDGITATLNGTTTAFNGIGSSNAGTTVTLNGVISGNSDLVFRVAANGGNGIMELGNNETYTGNTYILTLNSSTGGAIRLKTDNALPATTTLFFGGPATNTANVGAFDMAGKNQKVAGINVTTAATLGGITNSSGTTSTLTIDGNIVGNYAANLGNSTSGGGGNDNIALVLASTNTGTLNLGRLSGNSYNGGTTINGGKLIAGSDPSTSATGSGNVTVNNGGTLGGNGAVAGGGGALAVNSGGHIAPSSYSFTAVVSGSPSVGTITVTTGPIATLTGLGATTFNSGSKLDIDLGAPDPSVTASVSDRFDSPSSAVTISGGANSVGVNLSDPAGGAAGNGTYRIMSFAAGQFTGSATAFSTSSLPSSNSLNGATVAYHLFDDSNANQDANPSAATRVVAMVSGGPNALVWQGTASATWNTGDANFNNFGTGATGVSFAGNDNVTFDDTGSANTTVTVNALGVQPNIVSINNTTATTYTISGGDVKGSSLGGSSGLYMSGNGNATISSNYSGAGPIVSNRSGTGTTTLSGVISASTGVTVNGGTLTLAAANTYSGTNTINADSSSTVNGTATKVGTLSISADNNLGASTNSIVLGGGILKTTATFTLNSSRSISTTASGSTFSNDPSTVLTYGGVISGSGGLTQTGGGTLLLTGANIYTGNTAVSGGAAGSTLKIGADNALPTGTQLNLNGQVSAGTATFDLNGFNQTVGGATNVLSTGVTDSVGLVTNTASGAPKNFTINNSLDKNASVKVTGNLNFIKTGPRILALTAINSYTGDTKVLGGTLNIFTAPIGPNQTTSVTATNPWTPWLADGADVYLTTGSTLGLHFNPAGTTTDTIRSLYIDNVLQATGTWGAIGSAAAHTSSLFAGLGFLNVTIGGLPGDYNNDGKVDAGDYVMWRKNPSAFGGDPAGYNTWRANYGNPPGAGSGLGGAAVPEPTTLMLSLLMIGSMLVAGRRTR